MKKKFASTKKFVKDHQTAIAVTATAATALYLHIKVVGNLNDFLEEHNLLDVYYLVEEDIA